MYDSTCKKCQQGLILSLKLVNSVLVWWISFQDQNLGQGVKGSPINTHFYQFFNTIYSDISLPQLPSDPPYFPTHPTPRPFSISLLKANK